jgi:hypothetical protein
MTTAATVSTRVFIAGWARLAGQRTRLTVEAIWTRVQRASDPYRPELHYMRGPGPKWREKHGVTSRSGR